jgi:hypothetical protein
VESSFLKCGLDGRLNGRQVTLDLDLSSAPLLKRGRTSNSTSVNFLAIFSTISDSPDLHLLPMYSTMTSKINPSVYSDCGDDVENLERASINCFRVMLGRWLVETIGAGSGGGDGR